MLIDCAYLVAGPSGDMEFYCGSRQLTVQESITRAVEIARELTCEVEIHIKGELFWVVDELEDQWYNAPFDSHAKYIEPAMHARVNFIQNKTA